MAQRQLVRPIGLALNSARTHQFVRPFSTVLDAPVDPKTQQITPPTGRKGSVFEDALHAAGPRNNWTREEIAEVYNTPLIKLTYAAVSLNLINHGTPV
jgi:biotin synthase